MFPPDGSTVADCCRRPQTVVSPPSTGGAEERVQRHAPGEVVDRADEAGERALGDELEEVGVGQSGGVRLLDDVVADRRRDPRRPHGRTGTRPPGRHRLDRRRRASRRCRARRRRGTRAPWSGRRRRTRCRRRRRRRDRRSLGASAGTSGSATARRNASKAASSVGDAAATEARLGTKPRSAAMPSRIALRGSGGGVGREHVEVHAAIIGGVASRDDSLRGKRRRVVARIASLACP